jgi:hypothetical protein
MLGTMKRVALWLLAEVGEGHEFTKDELRQAFPGVSQIDRRMRDLRDFDWRIDTNREDPTLDMNQHRFVKAGLPVWEKGQAIRTGASAALGAARRREVISADGNMCRSCGITPGQTYAGTYETAQLDIARREVRLPGGATEVQLVTECNRCRVGGKELVADLDSLLRNMKALSEFESRVLAGWVVADKRDFSAVEQLWSDYRSLPAEARAAVSDNLKPS